MPFCLPMAINGAAFYHKMLYYSMDVKQVWLLLGNTFMLLTRKILKELAAVKLLQLLYVHKYGRS